MQNDPATEPGARQAGRCAERSRHTRRHGLTVLLAVLIAGTAYSSASAQVVLDEGHVDAVAPVYSGGQLQMQVKDGTGTSPVFRSPGDVLFRVKRQARITVPAGRPPAFAFMGAPGSAIWLLPQLQSDNPAVVWAGWSSETIAPGQLVADQLSWRLIAVDGPGSLQLFENGTFGQPRVIFDSADGLPDTELKQTGTHSHFNWVFHAPGLHRILFEVSGTAAGGAALTTGPIEYRFDVVGDAGSGGRGGSPSTSPGRRVGADIASVRMRGRVLRMRLTLSRRARVDVAVLRGKRVMARAKRRTLKAGTSTSRFKLTRRLAPGRYRVRLTASDAAGKTVRYKKLRVPRVPASVRSPR